jgi:hypothetical protein
MIAVLTSVLVGTFAGLLVAFAFDASLPISTSVGVVAFVVGVVIHQRYHWLYYKRIERSIPSHFPARDAAGS